MVKLFTVNMKELPGSASASTIGKNQSLNEIYATNDLDEEIDAAASGPNPEITLVETDEVYRCSVVGTK